jgi:hypothetical protein
MPIHSEFGVVEGQRDKECPYCHSLVANVAKSLTTHIDTCSVAPAETKAKYHGAAEEYRQAQVNSRKRRGVALALDTHSAGGGAVAETVMSEGENSELQSLQALAWIACRFSANSLDNEHTRNFLLHARKGYKPLNSHRFRQLLDGLHERALTLVDEQVGRSSDGVERVPRRFYTLTTDDTTSVTNTSIATVSLVAPYDKGTIVDGV